MLQDASKLCDMILKDMDHNPQEYINLLKRKIFNPHKCNIASDPYSEMPYQERKRISYILTGHNWESGNFSLLYAVLYNWIKDENMTIMECDMLYLRFGFPCNVIHPSQEQSVVLRVYEAYKKSDLYKAMIFKDVKKLEVRKNMLLPVDRSLEIYRSGKAKVFVEYWDYDWCRQLISNDNIWENMTLEEIVEQGRQGKGPVKRTEIPWVTRRREKYHTFMGGVYEDCREPAPERIKYDYLQDFEQILKLNVHEQRSGVKYENGREIGFTIFIDVADIIDLPIDWGKVEEWTYEEKVEFRKREEAEKRRKAKSDSFFAELSKRIVDGGRDI